MGTWALPQSISTFTSLIERLQSTVTANDATTLLYPIFGDNNLFDRIDKAAKIDRITDVRSLIRNRISQIYFTGQPTTEIICDPIPQELMDQINAPTKPNDIFFYMAAIRNASEAKKSVMWAMDAQENEAENYLAFREPSGMDFIVTDRNDRVFRVEAIDDVVLEIDLTNTPLYVTQERFNMHF